MNQDNTQPKDMTVEYFYSGFNLDFLSEEERQTIYDLTELFAMGKLRQQKSIDIETAAKEWISVEKELPKLSPPYFEDGMKLTPVTETCLVYDGESVYADFFSEDGFRNKYITHWMPLPKPPQP